MAWVKAGERKRNGTTTPWVRWENPDGSQHSQSFKPLDTTASARREAERERDHVAAKLRLDLNLGKSVNPARGKQRFAEWAAGWQARGRPSTQARDRYWLKRRIVPKWGNYSLGAITRDEVQRWVDELEQHYAPGTVDKILAVLGKVLGAAVRAERIAANPVDGIERTPSEDVEARFLTPDELVALERAVAAVNERYALLVPFLADVGLRIGEAAGLRWRDVDVDRGSVTVREGLVEVEGRRILGQPKTKAARRTVPTLTPEVALRLEEQRRGASASDFVWAGPTGAALGPSNFRERVWHPALKVAGLANPQPTPHSLRHTAVAHWIAAGVEPFRLRQWAGHRSLQMIDRTYGHLFPEDAAETRAALSAMRSAARDDAASRAQVVSLGERRRARH